MTERASTISTTTKLVVAGWMTMCATGMWQLAEHASSPGTVPTVMPRITNEVAARLNWPLEQNLLVLAAHPQCPCLAASLDELGEVLSSDTNLTVRILAFEPSVRPPEWDPTARDMLFQGLPKGTVILDQDGALAARLGATTSGHINVYQPNRELIFAGGITGSRGHRGDNQNRRALLQALSGKASTPPRTVVFGCSLQSPCECPQ